MLLTGLPLLLFIPPSPPPATAWLPTIIFYLFPITSNRSVERGYAFFVLHIQVVSCWGFLCSITSCLSHYFSLDSVSCSNALLEGSPFSLAGMCAAAAVWWAAFLQVIATSSLSNPLCRHSRIPIQFSRSSFVPRPRARSMGHLPPPPSLHEHFVISILETIRFFFYKFRSFCAFGTRELHSTTDIIAYYMSESLYLRKSTKITSQADNKRIYIFNNSLIRSTLIQRYHETGERKSAGTKAARSPNTHFAINQSAASADSCASRSTIYTVLRRSFLFVLPLFLAARLVFLSVIFCVLCVAYFNIFHCCHHIAIFNVLRSESERTSRPRLRDSDRYYKYNAQYRARYIAYGA